MSAFDAVKIVLDFNSREFRPNKMTPRWEGRPLVYFFWPAFCWQLVVRERRVTALNVFQEYVLRLCNAGIRDPQDIALKLFPPPERAENLGSRHRLAVRLLNELRRLDALDPLGGPTALGHEMLSGAGGESDEPASRYVFADPWTGALWDRFPSDIRSAIIDIHWPRDGQQPPLAKAVEGRKTIPGYLIRPSTPVTPPELQVADVERLYPNYVRDWYFEADLEEPGAGDGRADALSAAGDRIGDSLRVDVPSARIGNVLHIGDPEPAYLRTIAFLPGQGTRAAVWRVVDPFGLGVNPGFRERVDRFCRTEGAAFSAWRRDMLRDAPGAGPDSRIRDAEQLLDEAIGDRLLSHPQLYEDLLSAQRAALASQDALEEGHRREARDYITTAISNAQKALEWTLKIIDQSFPAQLAYGSFNLVPGERKAGAEELKRAARMLGLDGSTLPQKETLPDRLTHVDAGKIRKAADARKGSLNALVWAAVLAATANAKHPMAVAAKKHPRMLFDLSEIAELRDEVNHAVTNPLDFKDRVDDVLEKTRRCIALLLP